MSAAATATPVFDRLQPLERASVLDVLLRRYPELRAEAETAALAQLRRVSADETARQVVTRLADLELQDLAGRAGRVPGGYLHATEATYRLVEEALEPIQADLRRRSFSTSVASARPRAGERPRFAAEPPWIPRQRRAHRP